MSILVALLVAAVGGASAAQAADPTKPPPATADLVVRPIWAARPVLRDLQRLYPRNGRGATGAVSLDCLIDDAGRFSACDVMQEDPPGRGFAESSIRLSKLFRMQPVDGDGLPVAGRRLRLPIRWDGTLDRSE